MKNFITKVNKTGGDDSGSATSWGANESNSITDELKLTVTSTGQTLSPGTGNDPDATKLARAITIAGQTSHSYQDSGSANAYILLRTELLEQPTTYINGMMLQFKTANQNTGASTVNVSGLGVKKILDYFGDELSGSEISSSKYNELIYDPAADSSTGAFIINIKSSLRGYPGDDINLSYEPSPAQMTARRMLQRNGASLLRADFSDLFAIIGVTYGNVDGTHFNLPDDRGRFERIWDDGAGVDPDTSIRTDRGDGTTGDSVGTEQSHAGQGHFHQEYTANDARANNNVITTAGTGNWINTTTNNVPINPAGKYIKEPISDGVNGVPIVSSENRPANRYKWGGIFYALPFIVKLSYCLGSSAFI